MWIPILAGAASLASVLFVITAVVASRKSERINTLSKEASEHAQRLGDMQLQLDDRTKQLDEFRTKAERARAEAKQARKKVFEAEQGKGQPGAAEDLQRSDELALLEARAEAKRAREEALQAAAEIQAMQAKLEAAKAEHSDLKRSLAQAEQALEQARKQKPAAPAATGPDLQPELDKLRARLKAAEKRARNESQVYRVTNSKLELAMEKIATLEKQLAEKRA